MVGKAWHQETLGILEVSKQRKRTGSGARLYSLEACPKWCTSSSKVLPTKGCIICPNTNTNWATGIYTHDPMRSISFPSHSTSARKHPGFFHSYTTCSTCTQTSGIESCLLATLTTPIVMYQLLAAVSVYHLSRVSALSLSPCSSTSQGPRDCPMGSWHLHGKCLKAPMLTFTNWKKWEARSSESMLYSTAKGKTHLVKAHCHHSQKAISALSLIRGEKNQ